ncbi:hypothetical protein UCRNP2_10203 [Neofusicoccum parvum UCRNP2]|uniref:Rhodopsin domain-containing protein n=1 Tax=Botryosphaeria parva (strain UCR-NP2) TaxID=1287680 RepID=R1E6S4_BOTPV|nr:hypothetical protein UCRNP2_10203 [Neofusicoccum parvum UCRNP2]
MGSHIAVVLHNRGPASLDQYNLQAIYISALFYHATLGLTKLSILSLYRRILAGTPHRTLPRLTRAATALVALTTSANVCTAAFQCAPVAAAFTHPDHHHHRKSHCINRPTFYLATAATSIATDAAVYALAIAIIRPLRADPRRKRRALATLLVGLL